MSSLQSIRKNRLKKLANIQREGIDPYPVRTERTHTCQEVLGDFEKLAREKSRIILAGRLKSIRQHGGSLFAHLEDGAAKCQLYFKKDELGLPAQTLLRPPPVSLKLGQTGKTWAAKNKYKFFLANFDIGDFIEAAGELFLTKRGEKTLLVKDFRILAKALLPLPEKWHGLKDIEERFRKRYLDLIMNQAVRQKFYLRAQIIKSIREFLGERGFIEVETPILQLLPGGALARPFRTHLNALNLDLYLRVAPELFLKRLLVGGLEKVYEIGRCFRNEGLDWSHNPDFTMLEFYWAFADYEDLMKMTEEMFGYLLKQQSAINNQPSTISYQNHQIDFKRPWPRVEFSDLIKENCQLDIEKAEIKDLQETAKKIGLKLEPREPACKIIDEIYKKTCRPKLIQPCFVIHHPIEMTSLAKGLKRDSKKAARFQLVIAGLEIANAFSELNDPIEQVKRFKIQEKNQRAGDKEAQRYDKDFIEALEYGMPPAAGLGLGIDRLAALLTDSHSLREIILFPLMKPKR